MLLQLIEKERTVIELRQNTAKILQDKKNAWDRIATNFNSQKGIEAADVKTLKKVWDNLKTKAKKDVSKGKKERRLTGGGEVGCKEALKEAQDHP